MNKQDVIKQHSLNNKRFYGWALQNNCALQISYPRSGRGWTAAIYFSITGKQSVMPHTIDNSNYENYFVFTSHGFRLNCKSLLEKNSELKVILLVRDPRDCALSYAYYQVYLRHLSEKSPSFHSSLLKAYDAMMPESFKSSVNRIEELWARTINDFRQFNHIFVQYEHLCLNPSRVLKRIFNFIGCDMIVDFEQVVRELDKIKFESGMTRYLTNCLKWTRDDNWFQEYSDLIGESAYDTMEKFGYLPQGHDLKRWKELLS